MKGPNRSSTAQSDAWTLAIDFGTSNTVTVIKDRLGVRPVEDDGRPFFPSVVFAGEEGKLISGIAAFNKRLIEPRRYFTDVKKAITLGYRDVHLAGKPYPTVDVVAAVLREAKTAAMRFRPDPTEQPARTALTHPVEWDDDQIKVLCRAAELAELPAVTTFQEPVAAAFHLYHSRFQPGEHIAVYDLGGGTFDVALLQRTADSKPAPGQPLPAPYRVIDTAGDKTIGGERFDDKIWKMLGRGDLRDVPAWSALQDESRPDRQDEQRHLNWLVGRRELRERLVNAKVDLSTRDEAALFVPGTKFPYPITRADLEKELLPDFCDTVDLLSSLIRRNNLANKQIAHVALVGGSSQIPIVRQLLIERAQFDEDRVGTPAFAQTAVALGAAALVEVKGPESEAEQAFNTGEEWAARSGWKEAAAAYQHSIDCADSEWSPRAAYRLGQLRTQNPDRVLFRKSYDAAITAYRAAMAYRDSEWAASSALDLANLMLKNNRLDEAGVFLDNAVHANQPDVSPDAAFHLGLLHVRRGDWRSAEDAWQTAIDHKHPEWSPRAAYELGAHRKMRKNHPGAKNAWEIAMKRFKHPEWSPRAACELGELLREKGRRAFGLSNEAHQTAIETAYQTAIDSGHHEWSPRAAYGLGMTREKRRNWSGAVMAYQIAVSSGTPPWATNAVQRKSGILRHL